jgi:ATP-dependent DNA ligase
VKRGCFRILARKQGERVTLWSRRGADFTYRFPAIAEAVRGLKADEALMTAKRSCSMTTVEATSTRS